MRLIIGDFEYVAKVMSQNTICGTDKTYNLYTCLCDAEKYKQMPDIKIQLG